MILEVCVDSYTSMVTAKDAGANRIELCSALNIGGLTPSYGLMKQAKKIEGMEVFVMIRPRSGDFLYDENELETMKGDIDLVKEIGLDGIVIGILKSNGELDLEKMNELIKYANPLKVVLHRAFDDAKNPNQKIEQLIQMGICRILTSGQKKNAREGAEYIKEMQKEFGDRITFMPGCGVNHENIKEIYDITGCKNYHLSGKKNVGSGMEYRENIKRMDTSLEEYQLERADFSAIKSAREVLDNLYITY